MKGSTAVWIGVALLLAAGTGAVIVMSNWQLAGQLAAGTDLYNQLMSWFAAAEQANGIPPNLLARQGFQESGFKPDVINGTTASSAGAQGIMQIVPADHPGVDPLDPQAAINYAGLWMAQLYTSIWFLVARARRLQRRPRQRHQIQRHPALCRDSKLCR